MRELVLGNTNLVLSYDMKMNIRDLYYPRIGDENHLENNKNRIGFWVSGKFSWVDDEWKKSIAYKKDSLVSDITYESDYLGIRVKENSCIHYQKNVYLRILEIENLSNVEKDVRVFFHHMLKIYGETKNTTAIFDPISNSLIHYKKSRYFLFGGASPNTNMLYEYNIDVMDVGSEGNYKDAEDGKLEMNKVGQGRVNSMLSLRGIIGANEKAKFYYWICAGKNFEEVRELNNFILKKSVEELIKETVVYWNNWISKKNYNVMNLEKLFDLYKKSLMIMKTHTNMNGAVISSINYEHLQFYRDNYNYCWPRDAAMVAMAFDEAGYNEITRNIFRYLDKVILKSGYFWNKYYANGELASIWQPWIGKEGIQLPIQEDQTAFVLIALYNHYKISKDIDFIKEIYENLILKSINFLIEYIDEKTNLPMESYDLWEIKKGVHLLTVASVYEALTISKEFLRIFGETNLLIKVDKVLFNMLKSIRDYFFDFKENMFYASIKKNEKMEYELLTKYDASILLIVIFENFMNDMPEIFNTINKNIEKLWVKTEIGGVARFENDSYHQLTRDIKNIPGNPWIFTSLMAGIYFLKMGYEDKFLNILNNIILKSNNTGLLSEQVHPYTGEGISAIPYMLSHASFVLAFNKYIKLKK